MIIFGNRGDGMLRHNKNIVLFGALFLVSQLYFTVLSTHHAFMDMPTTCPICTLASNYDHAIIPPVFDLNFVSGKDFYYLDNRFFKPSFDLSFRARAPPVV